MKPDAPLTIAILLIGAVITLCGLVVLARMGLISFLVFYGLLFAICYRCLR